MAPRRAEPSILLGPILYFRGEQRDRWWLSALFVLDGEVEPDDLVAATAQPLDHVGPHAAEADHAELHVRVLLRKPFGRA